MSPYNQFYIMQREKKGRSVPLLLARSAGRGYSNGFCPRACSGCDGAAFGMQIIARSGSLFRECLVTCVTMDVEKKTTPSTTGQWDTFIIRDLEHCRRMNGPGWSAKGRDARSRRLDAEPVWDNQFRRLPAEESTTRARRRNQTDPHDTGRPFSTA